MLGFLIGNLHWVDILVIIIYLLASFGVGLWSICSSKAGLNEFFLAGRNVAWWPIGMSLFASNIGSLNFVGIAGAGAASGTAVIMFEWNAVWLLLMLGWVFLPVYVSSEVYTMPEYLQLRFGGNRLRIYLSLLQMTTYIFVTLSVDLFSGAVFIQQTLGWNIYAGVIFLLLITVMFTAFGGLTTVIFTDALAVFFMVIGGFALSVIGFVHIGGLAALQQQYMHSVPNTTLENPNTTCGYPREDALHIFRDAWESDYPWLGTILRTTVGSMWYWCTNQVLVQRALAAKNISHSKGATILAAYLKLTPMFIMVLTGMISRALYPNEVACVNPDMCKRVCNNAAGCSNIALPKLVIELLPIGFRGLMVATMIAAVISTLTSVFNSSSTLFTLDVWCRLRPKASQRELLYVGKLFVVFLTVAAIMWIPIVSGAEGGEVFKYSTAAAGYLSSPTCAVFVLAMFWHRCNEAGAFWGMLLAQAWGLVRFVMDFIYPTPGCETEDTRPWMVRDVHAYYHSVSQVILAFATAVTVSLLTTKGKEKEKLGGLTFWNRHLKPWKDILHAEENDFEVSVKHSEQIEMCSEANSPFTKCIGQNKGQISMKCAEDCGHTDDFESRMTYLTEKPFWKRFVNINAILVMVVTVILYGIFF